MLSFYHFSIVYARHEAGDASYTYNRFHWSQRVFLSWDFSIFDAQAIEVQTNGIKSALQVGISYVNFSIITDSTRQVRVTFVTKSYIREF